MDDRRFDGLTKAFASGSSRRTLLKGLLGLSSATIPASLGSDVEAARRPKPTPKAVSCPGQQIWDGNQCVCPGGLFGCGPDCCGAPDQCCDNACCDAGSVCVAEEQCCPVAQVCPYYPGGPCCPDGTLCCPSGDACYDPNAGGCCSVDDCPAEFCNPVTCDGNVCVYTPLPDGEDCGDCATCQFGVCTTSCLDSEICCLDEEICVDFANNGCCTAADCPRICGKSQTCQDHQCLAPEPRLCQDFYNPHCCSSDEICHSFYQTDGTYLFDLCCSPENDPCLTADGIYCCLAGEECREVTVQQGISMGDCCIANSTMCQYGSGDALYCCPPGFHCVNLGEGITESCCPDDITACDPGSTPPDCCCCNAGQVCDEDNNCIDA